MWIYRQSVRAISFPLFARRDGLPGLMGQLKALGESQYWPRDRIRELQGERVRRLLAHAYDNTNYYRRRFDAAGFHPRDFRGLEDLRQLPTLSKKIIRANLRDLIATTHDESELHSAETGGTTGAKMVFYRDNACLAAKEAGLYRFESWAGWEPGDRVGLVWPAMQDYVGHWTMRAKLVNELYKRHVTLPAAILDHRIMGDYLRLLQRKRPSIIRAFTSPVFELAKYVLDQGIRIRVKGVITTGEPLHRHQRETIAKAFHCPVFDSYRTREAGSLAQECEEHGGLHINAESLYVETVPLEDATVVDGGLGELVITDLFNYGMPLIRYRMGDMGQITKASCPCGRGLPMIRKIKGRTADLFFTPTGKRINSVTLVLYLVDEAPGLLGQVQIVQDRIDHLIIRMTPDPGPTDEIKQYQKNMVKSLFGDEMEVSFEIVDEIAREKSGKYKFTKCLIRQPE